MFSLFGKLSLFLIRTVARPHTQTGLSIQKQQIFVISLLCKCRCNLLVRAYTFDLICAFELEMVPTEGYYFCRVRRLAVYIAFRYKCFCDMSKVKIVVICTESHVLHYVIVALFCLSDLEVSVNLKFFRLIQTPNCSLCFYNQLLSFL